MLKIRLQRVGRKNIPVFRIVLTDSKNSTKSGKYLEVLGSYDPVNDVKDVKADRIKYWMLVGAKPTDTLHNFLIDKQIISGKKINALPRKNPIKPAPTPAQESAQAETLGKKEVAQTEASAPAGAQEQKPDDVLATETPVEAK